MMALGAFAAVLYFPKARACMPFRIAISKLRGLFYLDGGNYQPNGTEIRHPFFGKKPRLGGLLFFAKFR